MSGTRAAVLLSGMSGRRSIKARRPTGFPRVIRS
jgi:hypothetical protein